VPALPPGLAHRPWPLPVQNLLCAYLAAAVLAGLLVNTLLGWWLDPVIGLGIAVWAIWEGVEAGRGEE
jgi:divalent metal cation (Fe/Co/Zn/Cd) transporter